MLIKIDQRFLGDELKAEAHKFAQPALAALEGIRSKQCRGAEWTGWYDFPRDAGFSLWREVSEHVRQLSFLYDLVVVVGIGGSYLGTRALNEVLSHSFQGIVEGPGSLGHKPLIVYAGHTLSETALLELLDLMAQREPIINVVSKSGTTTEPGVAFRVLRRYMEQRYGDQEAAKRIIATTDPERGALRRLSGDLSFKTFPIPKDVGGRFSVLSAVGMVPMALAHQPMGEVLRGADLMFREIEQALSGSGEHPVLAYAAIRAAAFSSGKSIELLVYSEPRLAVFVEWFKQLFAESEGKEGKGLFPSGFGLTTDLHSLGQWVQEGPRIVFETFLSFDYSGRDSAAGVERRLKVPHLGDNLDELGFAENRFLGEVDREAQRGTRLAHADGGVPNIEISCARLDPLGLGALIAFFEVACGIGGALLGVNPYDQPGVESYKNNLFGLLGKPGYDQFGAAVRQRFQPIK